MIILIIQNLFIIQNCQKFNFFLFILNLFKFRKNTNAIILWTEVEYKNDLNNDPLILSTGLLKKCKVNNSPKWHRGYRQCVHFLSKNDYFIDTTKNGIKISFDFI